MAKTVPVRFDKSGENALSEIMQILNCNESDAVRRALEYFGRSLVKPSKGKIVGLGSFESGVSDLGSTKKHLAQFGY